MRTRAARSGWLHALRIVTAATVNPNNFEYVARPQVPVVGEALIATGWLLTIAVLNLFYAISVLAGSHIFITTASWLVGDTRPEGWLMLIVALVQLAAVPGVLLGKLGAVGVGMLSVLGHVVAAIMFFGDSLAIAIALLLIDITVFLCLVSVARSARLAAS